MALNMPPEYRTWSSMKTRCNNPKVWSFKYYGGRGIKICERWTKSFWDFLSDMGPKPTPKHSIDRIDSNGDYEPKNCRWATVEMQINGRRLRVSKVPTLPPGSPPMSANKEAKIRGVSRQYIWSLRCKEKGLCMSCGQRPLINLTRCKICHDHRAVTIKAKRDIKNGDSI